LLLYDHPARHSLRQEVGRLQVDANQPLEALLTCLQDVCPHLWGDARVVHQHVQPSETLANRLHQLLALVRLRDVRLKILHRHPRLLQFP
jgi:hypothetical protein